MSGLFDKYIVLLPRMWVAGSAQATLPPPPPTPSPLCSSTGCCRPPLAASSRGLHAGTYLPARPPQQEASLRFNTQRADSILNHMLKNAIAESMGCVDMFLRQLGKRRESTAKPDTELLRQAIDTLLRAIRWCKLREAMISIAGKDYSPEPSWCGLEDFAAEISRGRPAVQVCNRYLGGLLVPWAPEIAGLRGIPGRMGAPALFCVCGPGLC